MLRLTFCMGNTPFKPDRMQSRGWRKSTSALTCLGIAGAFCHGQQAIVSDPSLQRSPVSWVEAAAKNENAIVQDAGTSSVSYRVHKVDAKGDTVREVIESRQGSVARLIEHDGKPITAAEDAAERERLQAALAAPDEFLRHHRRDNVTREYAMEMCIRDSCRSVLTQAACASSSARRFPSSSTADRPRARWRRQSST